MKLAIIGTGYVGLITGACFAEFGYETVCIDKDEKRVEELNNSQCPFYEPGVDDLLDKHLNKTKLLSFSSSLSESVKDAANVFYWLIGIVLILPFLLFYLYVQNEKTFAEEFASKKNRLAWLTSKLQQKNPSGNDLARALRAVSSLEWEKALEVWGEAQIRHFTTGIDIAIWSMDSKVNANQSWQLLIGVCAKECDWNVAALRFESPEGQAWNVKKVEPKLLTRGTEIFLDSISQNSRTFIQVELEGNGNSLDIHVSGMVGGEPMAAKPVRTMYRDEFQSEE